MHEKGENINFDKKTTKHICILRGKGEKTTYLRHQSQRTISQKERETETERGRERQGERGTIGC